MSHSWSLICFTLLVQSAVGLVLTEVLAHGLGGNVQAAPAFRTMALALILTCAGLLTAVAHLAAPQRAHHALRNPATSWLSREVVLVPIFAATLALAMAGAQRGGPGTLIALELAALLAGSAALWAMTGVYLLKTVPAWNTPATILEFMGSALLLGGALAAASASLGSGIAIGWRPEHTAAATGMLLGMTLKMAAIPPAITAEHTARDQTWYLHPSPALSAVQSRGLRAVLNVAGTALILSTAAQDGAWPGLYLGLTIIIGGEVAGRLRFFKLYGRMGL